MSVIFLIPGVGADCRIFNRLHFDGHDVMRVDWVTPDSTDTLTTYAQKLIDQYNIAPGSIVIGNSMGGMIAIEMGKIIPLKKIILISSIRTADEAPGYFNFFRSIPVYKIIPENALSSLDYILELFFGNLEKLDKGLFLSMLRKWSPEFLKWAIDAVLKWDNKVVPENTWLITGDKDLVFPYKNAQDAIVVKGGTHVMIYDKAHEISKILKDILNSDVSLKKN
ncbi:MAG TPA: alpha/beta hydrolase [Mucilaginibacter sp.]|jgi:pimeloyl-ACP methyl ester carboxylesterase|nr:alpha/beta hydrolase [Mucilaginibacter sp.]